MFEAVGAKPTHNHVIAELVALSSVRGLPRPATLDFIDGLLEHPEIRVVRVDAALNAEALTLLKARPDKNYSLCDAISFVLMRRNRLRNALTTDHHFVPEGFFRLLT